MKKGFELVYCYGNELGGVIEALEEKGGYNIDKLDGVSSKDHLYFIDENGEISHVSKLGKISSMLFKRIVEDPNYKEIQILPTERTYYYTISTDEGKAIVKKMKREKGDPICCRREECGNMYKDIVTAETDAARINLMFASNKGGIYQEEGYEEWYCFHDVCPACGVHIIATSSKNPEWIFYGTYCAHDNEFDGGPCLISADGYTSISTDEFDWWTYMEIPDIKRNIE